MKKYYSFLILILVATVAFGDQQVGSNLDLNGNQIKNADIDGGTASNSNRLTVPKNTKTTLDGLTRKEGTVVYSTDQAKLFVDNGSSLTPVGSGSGSSGEVNAVTNPNAATDLTGYADSDAGSDVSRDTTAANLALYPTIETGVKVNADDATEYISYCGAMPAGLKNRKLKLEWFQVPESGYATGDQKLEVYSTTSSTCASSLTRLALSTDASSVTAIPNATGKFTTTADTNSDGYFQIRWVRVSGTKSLTLQNIIYGPGIQPQGAVVTEWQSYTPTVTNLPTSITTARYRRVGSSVEIMANATASGAATGEIRISLPTGLTINTSAITAQDASTIFGHAEARTSGGSAYHDGNVIWLSTTAVRIIANGGSGYTWDATHPFTWANGDVLTIKFTVPIAEWAGSGTLNVVQSGDYEVAYNSGTWDATDSTSFAYGWTGGSITGTLAADRKKRIRFQTPMQNGQIVTILVKESGGSYLPVGIMSRNDSGTIRNVQTLTRTSSVSSGVGVQYVSSTDFDVVFGIYTNTSGSTYASAGDGWSAFSGGAWVAVKHYPWQAVGFGAATATQSGLVSKEASMAEGDLGAITIGGGTWSTIDSKKYKWAQTGKQVTFVYRIESTVAASSLSEMFFSLPSDAPAPSIFSTTGTDEWLGYTGPATWDISGNATAQGGAITGIYYVSAGNFRVYFNTLPGGNAKAVRGTITYLTD